MEEVEAPWGVVPRLLAPAVNPAPGVFCAAEGGTVPAAGPGEYAVGVVLQLRLRGRQRSVLGNRLRVADPLAPAVVTARVMARLTAQILLVQCEGWRHDGLVWLHAELDGHLLSPLGPEGPQSVGPDGALTEAIFQRLQFGVLMLLSQGRSYWDLPALLFDAPAAAPAGKSLRPGYAPASLRSHSQRTIGALGFDSPKARMLQNSSAVGARAEGSEGDAAVCAPKEIELGTGDLAEQPPASPRGGPRPSAAAEGKYRAAFEAGRREQQRRPDTPSLASRGVGPVGRDPRQLFMYRQLPWGLGGAWGTAQSLDVRLEGLDVAEWRLSQEPPAPFRTCYEAWGLAQALAPRAGAHAAGVRQPRPGEQAGTMLSVRASRNPPGANAPLLRPPGD
jgi:hypothetical protein